MLPVSHLTTLDSDHCIKKFAFCATTGGGIEGKQKMLYALNRCEGSRRTRLPPTSAVSNRSLLIDQAERFQLAPDIGFRFRFMQLVNGRREVNRLTCQETCHYR